MLKWNKRRRGSGRTPIPKKMSEGDGRKVEKKKSLRSLRSFNDGNNVCLLYSVRP